MFALNAGESAIIIHAKMPVFRSNCWRISGGSGWGKIPKTGGFIFLKNPASY
jgi:hypothetical protein